MEKNNQPISDDDMRKKTKKTPEDALGDEVARAFDDVIEPDERILLSYKPCKEKVYFAYLMGGSATMFLLVLFVAISLFAGGWTGSGDDIICLVVPIVLFVLSVVFAIVFAHLFCKNTIYALTNKRVLIRTGIIGVDYKSLDLKNIGASNVYVSFLDKILRKNTGTIRFGSASSPMTANNTYAMAHVRKPYELYKEVKSRISDLSRPLEEK